jgi:hypothetical protein
MRTVLLTAVLALSSAAAAAQAAQPSWLAGTWTLTAADRLTPDGSRVRDYGEHPKGRLIIDAQGRYSLQIFKAERARFALGDKRKGSPAEYEAAVLGSSTHYGTIAVDEVAHVLAFTIDGASYPNWEGGRQMRRYALEGDVLSYQVPAAPDGAIAISVWRREP